MSHSWLFLAAEGRSPRPGRDGRSADLATAEVCTALAVCSAVIVVTVAAGEYAAAAAAVATAIAFTTKVRVDGVPPDDPGSGSDQIPGTLGSDLLRGICLQSVVECQFSLTEKHCCAVGICASPNLVQNDGRRDKYPHGKPTQQPIDYHAPTAPRASKFLPYAHHVLLPRRRANQA